MRTAWEIAKPQLNPHIERMKHRAVKTLQMLSPYEKQLLEDHLIEGVSLERLGREQDLDRRTIRKRIKRAIQRLREAEKDLP
jgi:DNA-directed RNA polymerase specialized sigma24 family protein